MISNMAKAICAPDRTRQKNRLYATCLIADLALTGYGFFYRPEDQTNAEVNSQAKCPHNDDQFGQSCYLPADGFILGPIEPSG